MKSVSTLDIHILLLKICFQLSSDSVYCGVSHICLTEEDIKHSSKALPSSHKLLSA